MTTEENKDGKLPLGTADKEKRNRLLFLLGCGQGPRSQELLGLNIEDVYSKQKQQVLKIATYKRANQKGKQKPRYVPIKPEWHDLILQVVGTRDPKEPLFTTNAQGRRMKRSTLHKIIMTACEVAGVNTEGVSSHTFRKTFAHRLFQATKDIIKVQKAMGHRQISTTMKYLSVDVEEVNKDILAINL